MSTSISGVHVTVDDPDAALAFYRDSLGMTVANRVDKDGFSWITLTTEAQPDISIVLSQPHGGRSQEDGDALATLLAKGALPCSSYRSRRPLGDLRQAGGNAGRRGASGAGRPVLGCARRSGARSRRQHDPRRAGLGDGCGERRELLTEVGAELAKVRHELPA